MTDSHDAGRRWRRIAATLLFDGSLAAAALGIARWMFGVAIDVLPGPALPLGSGGPWPPLVLAAALFVVGAAIAPVRRSARSPAHQAASDNATTTDGVAIGPGPADVAASAPVPRDREKR